MSKLYSTLLCCALILSFCVPARAQGAGEDQTLLGKSIGERLVELKESRSEYLGGSGGQCKASGATVCFKDGACCTSGSLCKILYSKIAGLANTIPGESASPNFCN